MENKPIYVITTFEKWPADKDPWNYGAYRSPGFYYTFEDAEDSVINNCCDIWECLYNYTQITKMEPGMYGYNGENWYYKYNMESGKYERMDDVEHLFVHICGIG